MLFFVLPLCAITLKKKEEGEKKTNNSIGIKGIKKGTKNRCILLHSIHRAQLRHLDQTQGGKAKEIYIYKYTKRFHVFCWSHFQFPPLLEKVEWAESPLFVFSPNPRLIWKCKDSSRPSVFFFFLKEQQISVFHLVPNQTSSHYNPCSTVTSQMLGGGEAGG